MCQLMADVTFAAPHVKGRRWVDVADPVDSDTDGPRVDAREADEVAGPAAGTISKDRFVEEQLALEMLAEEELALEMPALASVGGFMVASVRGKVDARELPSKAKPAEVPAKATRGGEAEAAKAAAMSAGVKDNEEIQAYLAAAAAANTAYWSNLE